MSISIQSSTAALLTPQTRNSASELQDQANAGGPPASSAPPQDGASAGAVSLARQLSAHNGFVSLQTGVGQLVDGDLATESAKLQALQVQQQLSGQPFSIANQGPQLILQLFKS